MSPIVLLFLGTALAADTTPPTWPEGAWLQVGKDQALYDSPAATEAELRRRDSEVKLSLYWPTATDDQGVVAYHIFYDQQERSRVAGDVRTWGARVQDGTENWAVVPVDAAGNRGPRLEGRVDRVVPYDPDDGSLVLMVGIRGDGGGAVGDVLLDDPEFTAALDAALSNAVASGAIAVATPEPAEATRTQPDAALCDAALRTVERFHDHGNTPMRTISVEACVQAFSEDHQPSDLAALACFAAADSDEAWLTCWTPGDSVFDDRDHAALRVVNTLRGTAGVTPSRGGGLPRGTGLGEQTHDQPEAGGD